MGRMTIRNAVKALAPYRFTPHAEPVKLDQNESPDDVPATLKARVVKRLADGAWNRYPDLTPTRLEARLAEHAGWDPDGVVVGNGSNTLIQALTVVAALGRRVVTVAPTFAVYATQARLLDAELVEVPLGPRFALPVEALRAVLAEGDGAFFLANPAAPTGNLFGAHEVAPLLEAAASGTLAVLDEAYAEFAGAHLTELVARHPHAVSLRTFSKALGLAGARVGYALAHPEVARELRKALLPFSLDLWQLTVAEVLLDEPALVTERVAHVARERARLTERLAALPGLEPFPSRTNFVLFRAPDPAALHAALLRAGVVIRRQDHLPGAAGCLRVSVGTAAENDTFLAACRSALEAGADAAAPSTGGPR